jgi:hypothetical protein
MASPQLTSFSQFITPDAIVIYPSGKRMLLPMLLCGSFVIIGLFLFSKPDDGDSHMIAIACIVVFGGAMLYPVARLVRSTPTLIIHSSGLFDNGSALSSGFLPWEEISNVKIATIGNQRYLAIQVKDKSMEAFLRRQSGLKAFIMRMNSRWFGAAVYISALNLSMPLEEIIAKIREKRRGADHHGKIHDEAEDDLS